MRFPEIRLPITAGVATYPPGATFGPRRMTDYEFVWMMEGDAEYQWGEARADAPSGSFVLCRPGATDGFVWDRQKRTRHGFFHFEIDSIPDDWPPPALWPLVRVGADDDLLNTLFRHILTWAGHGDDRQTVPAILTLLATFITGELAVGTVGQETWPDAVDRAYRYLMDCLERDPASPIRLPEMARAACVTPEHLCRLFARSLGHSPAEVVRLARLDRAATLLARSNYTISEIAAICGFANPFHFSRLFKNAYGTPPTHVRRMVRAGATPPLARLLKTVPTLPAPDA